MKPPLFWSFSPDSVGPWPRILAPLSAVWRGVAARRWSKGAHLRLPVPVVCIGNINLGGTGKTPTVIEVVTRLIDLGKSVHIVSRGYGGSLSGPVQVDLHNHKADQVGDEPLLLAAFAPCWVSKDRAIGAQRAVEAGADVIVLDDGMQNPALFKDLTVLVVDAQTGFGNGYVFPSGPLRQNVAQGVLQADLILSIGSRKAQKYFDTQWGSAINKPQTIGELVPLQTGMDWQGMRALAFAGIGRPQKFFDTLNAAGADIVACHAFSDHQKLPLAALHRMEKEAVALGAQLVTTEKDAVRLPASYQQKVLTLPVRLVLDDPEPLVTALSRLFD